MITRIRPRFSMRLFVLMALLLPHLPALGAAPEAQPEVGTPAPRLTEGEKSEILRQMKQRILKEDRDFDADEKNRRKDLVRSQGDRRKEWREKERKARRAFFEAHGSGPERRAYVQAFVKRKKDFDFHEKLEWTEFKHQQKEARDALEASHRDLTRKVKGALEAGVRPEGF